MVGNAKSSVSAPEAPYSRRRISVVASSTQRGAQCNKVWVQTPVHSSGPVRRVCPVWLDVSGQSPQGNTEPFWDWPLCVISWFLTAMASHSGPSLIPNHISPFQVCQVKLDVSSQRPQSLSLVSLCHSKHSFVVQSWNSSAIRKAAIFCFPKKKK